MGGFAQTKHLGDLLVGTSPEVSLRTPAWEIHNIAVLQFDSELRGEGEVIPGRDGEVPNTVRQSATVWPLDFSIQTRWNHLGERYADTGGYPGWSVGIASNMNYLRTHVLTGRTLTGNRTRPAKLVVPGETLPRTADVHIWLSPGNVLNRNIWKGTLYVKVYDGMFL